MKILTVNKVVEVNFTEYEPGNATRYDIQWYFFGDTLHINIINFCVSFFAEKWHTPHSGYIQEKTGMLPGDCEVIAEFTEDILKKHFAE